MTPALPPGLVIGDDDVARCWWGAADPLYRQYHDAEWGRPVAADPRLFEMLCLEGFQAGLSWQTAHKWAAGPTPSPAVPSWSMDLPREPLIQLDPATRATLRLQEECRDPDVTFRLVERMEIPADARVQVSARHWPNGEPVVTRTYWPKDDAES